MTKVITKDNLERELQKLKSCSDRLDRGDDSKEVITLASDSLALVSNLMFVSEIGKSVCKSDNMDMLVKLFNRLSNFCKKGTRISHDQQALYVCI